MKGGQGAVSGGWQGAGAALDPYIKRGVFIVKTTAPIWAAIPGVNTVGAGILALDALQKARQKEQEAGRATDEYDAQIAGTQAKIDALKAGQSNDVANVADADAYEAKNKKFFGLSKGAMLGIGAGALAVIAAVAEHR